MNHSASDSAAILYEDQLPGGCHWSMLVKKDLRLRLLDTQGGGNVGMLFYNPNNYLERYNAPDTLKGQHTFKLTQGHCLYSDMGRIFCSIVDDTLGWHDTVCGNTTRDSSTARWGEKSYQDYRNEWQQNGHDAFLVELGKYGLGVKDLAANVNWFSSVAVDERGDMQYRSNNQGGHYVELRFEMDTLVVMHTCPHPMNPASEYPRVPITYQIRSGEAVAEDDPCINACGENQRGFQNTTLYNLTAQ